MKNNKLKKIKREFIVIFTIGFIYFLIESLFRGLRNWPSLIANASLWMIIVGCFSGQLLSLINRCNFIRKNFNAFSQNILGMIGITSIEFLSGVIFSSFGLKIWGYSHLKYDWLAQVSGGHVSFTFMFFWFLLSPLGYFLFDYLSWLYFREGNKYSLLKVYSQLFKFWIKPNIQEKR